MINPFFGPRGLRSGWRVLAFLVMAFLIGGSAQAVGRSSALLQYGLFLLGVLAATWVMAKLDGKPMGAYGLAGLGGPSALAKRACGAWAGRRPTLLLLGLVSGFAALSVVIVLLIAVGAFRPGGQSLHGTQALYWAAQSAILFLLVGFSEELITRGYPLFALWESIGFWPAAAIVSLLFAAGHLGNGGEDWIGLGNAVLVGLVFAYSAYWSGSLWWAIGCHASWDWAETYFYGVADSGVAPQHHFFSGTPAGPWWLSGGTAGPEGSVLAAVVIVALAGVVRLTLPRRAPDAPESSPAPAAP